MSYRRRSAEHQPSPTDRGLSFWFISNTNTAFMSTKYEETPGQMPEGEKSKAFWHFPEAVSIA
jgi:hypothetical protein